MFPYKPSILGILGYPYVWKPHETPINSHHLMNPALAALTSPVPERPGRFVSPSAPSPTAATPQSRPGAAAAPWRGGTPRNAVTNGGFTSGPCHWDTNGILDLKKGNQQIIYIYITLYNHLQTWPILDN